MAMRSLSESFNNRPAPVATHKACAAHLKRRKRSIEVNDNNPGRFHVNEEVTLCGQSSLGLQAVFLAFVLPLIVVVAAIVAGSCLQWDETTSGLTGLLLLVPYYSILYFLREKLKRKFIFTLKKLN